MGAEPSAPLPRSSAAVAAGTAAASTRPTSLLRCCSGQRRAGANRSNAAPLQRGLQASSSSMVVCGASRKGSGGSRGRDGGGKWDAEVDRKGGFVRNTRRERAGNEDAGGEEDGGGGRGGSKERGGVQPQKRRSVISSYTDLKISYGGGEYDPGKARDLPSLAALVQQGAASWNLSRLCAAFNRAGKLCSTADADTAAETPERADLHRTLDTLAAAYLPLVPGVDDAKRCVQPLWACAKAGYWGGGLAAALLEQLGQDGGTLLYKASNQDHANLWWSLSTAPEEAREAGLTAELLRTSAGCLLRTAMGPADLEPQDCSNVLLACARLGYTDPALLRALAAAAGQAVGRMDEQNLANSLYALAVLECKGPAYGPVLHRLTAEVEHRLQRQPYMFKPQTLSNTLYGLALLQQEHGHPWSAAVLERLAAECKRRQFVGFTAQGLANSAWGLAKLGYRDQSWFVAAVAAAVRPGTLRALTPQGLSNLWYALALVRHRAAAALMEATAGASEVLGTQANGQECANLLWSLATLGVPYEPRLVDLLVGRLVELLPRRGGVAEQDLANSLWALAVMGPAVLSRLRALLGQLLREVVSRWKAAVAAAAGDGSSAGPFQREELAQLWQVQQELPHADGFDELAGILAAGGGGVGSHGSLLSAMRRAVKEEGGVEADASASRLQRQVAAALGRLRRQRPSVILSVSGEQEVEGMVGRVDVVVELGGGRRVAVEADGPWHFMANDPHTRTRDGPTQLRDRQLRRLFGAGNAMSVPYWEWDELRGDQRREEAYLLHLLLGLSADGP